MLKPIVTLKAWNITASGISGDLESGNKEFVWDTIVAIAKEADDVMIVEGQRAFYKLNPPWRMK